jgi:hypothetical protein
MKAGPRIHRFLERNIFSITGWKHWTTYVESFEAHSWDGEDIGIAISSLKSGRCDEHVGE